MVTLLNTRTGDIVTVSAALVDWMLAHGSWVVQPPGVTSAVDASDSYINLAEFGLSSVSDLTTYLTQAAAFAKHIVLPSRGTPWPMLTKWVATDTILEFEPGAKISLNMPTGGGMEITGGGLINPSFTSSFTGLSGAGDYANYGFPAREILLHTGARILGTFYKDHGATGLHIDGNHISVGDLFVRYIRHRSGWGSALHIDNPNAYDIRIGHVYAEECDRGVEIEAGSHDITLAGGGYLKNIYPNGYTGQPANTSNVDAAIYATYTSVVDCHSHSGEGAVEDVAFKGEWTLENCGNAVNFTRATGTNDSDLPRNCTVDTVTLKGRSAAAALGSGTESVMIHGYHCGIDKLRLDPGAGVAASGRFRVAMQDGFGGFINKLLAEAFDTPLLEVRSSMVGASFGEVRPLDGKVSGGGYVVDIAGPQTKIGRLDCLAVGNGSSGYIRFTATADQSRIETFNWTKKGADTWVDPVLDLSQNTLIGSPGTPALPSNTVGLSGKFLSVPNRAVSSQQLSNQTLRTTPIFIPRPMTIDQIGTEIVTAGNAGAVMRLGIFEDAQGFPGDPIADVTVAADAIATPMATLGTPLTLLPGWYHFGGVPQNAATTAPFVRSTVNSSDDYLVLGTAVTTTAPVGYSKGGISGALANFGTSVSNTNVAPRLWLRLA